MLAMICANPKYASMIYWKQELHNLTWEIEYETELL